jgi:N-acetylmuramoyl-L-alanine amidase
MFGSNLHIKSLKAFKLLLFFIIFILPSPVSSQQKEVVAEKGDGIIRLLSRHGLSSQEHFNAFIELNKNDLGKDNTLIAGKKYKLPDMLQETTDQPPASAPVTNKTAKHKILGQKYENVEILSNQLNGAIYYLVAGHGGPDPGAIGKYENHSLCEDEYAYDVTLRLARNLIQNSATVYMITRDPNDGIRDENFLKPDKDEVCYPNLTIP